MFSIDSSKGILAPGFVQTRNPNYFSGSTRGLIAYYNFDLDDAPDFTNNIVKNIAGSEFSAVTYVINTAPLGISVFATGYTQFAYGAVGRQQIPNSSVIISISCYSLSAGTIVVKIANRISSTSYNILQVQSFSHGGTGWETVTLTNSFLVPATGEYVIGCYTTIDVSGSANHGYYGYVLGDQGTGLATLTDTGAGNNVSMYCTVLTEDHATLVNLTSAAWTNGQIGSALSFNGSNQYIDLGTKIGVVGTGSSSLIPAFTTIAWVNPTDLSINAYNAIHAGTNNYFLSSVKSNGKLAQYMQTTGGTISYDGTGSHTLKAGNWYQIAMSYDSTAGLKGYVNAELDNSAGANGTNLFTGPIHVGHDPINGRYWKGLIDNFRLYNRVLSQDEILALYRNGIFGRKDAMDALPIETWTSAMSIPAAGPSFIPAWATQSNIPIIGAGIY